MSKTHDELIESLGSLTVEQLIELTKALERELGVDPRAAFVRPFEVVGGYWPIDPIEERYRRLRLISVGSNRVHVMQVLRENMPSVARLTPQECKSLIDRAPVTLPSEQDELELGRGQQLVEQLKSLGAIGELVIE
ncbi:MAG: hypothetical protein U0165_08635 [Polyangiaceae bacterium]